MARGNSLLWVVLALFWTYTNAQGVVGVDIYGLKCHTQTVCLQTAQYGPSSSGLITVRCPVTSRRASQATTTIATTTTTGPTNTLGYGLPSGTISSIPFDIIIGFTYDVPFTKEKRQTRSPSSIVGYLHGSGQYGGTITNCSYATRFSLNSGTLENKIGQLLGKNNTYHGALLSPWLYSNDITTSFSFVNGILVWKSPDLGIAKFYQCGFGPLYAGFPDAPFPDCIPVTVGGIISSACPADLTNATKTSTSSKSSTSTTSTVVVSISSSFSSNGAASSTLSISSVSSASGTSSTIASMSGSLSSTGTASSISSTSSVSSASMTTVVSTGGSSTSTGTASSVSSASATTILSTGGSSFSTGTASSVSSASTTSNTGSTSSTTILSASGSSSSTGTVLSTSTPPTSLTLPPYANTTVSGTSNPTSLTSISTLSTSLPTTSITTSPTNTGIGSSTSSLSNSISTAATSTTSNTFQVTNPAITTYPPASVAATAPVAQNFYCPPYDNSVIYNPSQVSNYYQIYCDADIDGTDIPPPYGNSAVATDFNTCLDLCNTFNSQSDGYCQAVSFYQGVCILKTNIYQQTNTPAGVGYQYNYYKIGVTAAQLLDQTYPVATDTKASGPGTITSSITVSVPTTSVSSSSSSLSSTSPVSSSSLSSTSTSLSSTSTSSSSSSTSPSSSSTSPSSSSTSPSSSSTSPGSSSGGSASYTLITIDIGGVTTVITETVQPPTSTSVTTTTIVSVTTSGLTTTTVVTPTLTTTTTTSVTTTISTTSTSPTTTTTTTVTTPALTTTTTTSVTSTTSTTSSSPTTITTTTITTTTSTSTTTTTTTNPVTNPAYYPFASKAAVPAGSDYSAYDDYVVADLQNAKVQKHPYGYQIFIDASIDGYAIPGGTAGPPGYSAGSLTGMDACLDLCSAWSNYNFNGYCEAVVLVGGACLPKYNIYQQSGTTNYAYYDQGYTAAMLLRQSYPRPNEKSPTPPS